MTLLLIYKRMFKDKLSSSVLELINIIIVEQDWGVMSIYICLSVYLSI